ncbi:uncharacterized protein FOMMEDRAFT_32517, partial [Fomitiporia mediterranea MF3/22]
MPNTFNKALPDTLAKLADLGLDLSGCIEYEKVPIVHGGYCTVYIGTVSLTSKESLKNSEEETKMNVTVKELCLDISASRDSEKILAKELYIWSKIKHANILSLQGFILEN